MVINHICDQIYPNSSYTHKYYTCIHSFQCQWTTIIVLILYICFYWDLFLRAVRCSYIHCSQVLRWPLNDTCWIIQRIRSLLTMNHHSILRSYRLHRYSYVYFVTFWVQLGITSPCGYLPEPYNFTFFVYTVPNRWILLLIQLHIFISITVSNNKPHSENMTGPAKIGHICTNYRCLENGTFLDHCLR